MTKCWEGRAGGDNARSNGGGGRSWDSSGGNDATRLLGVLVEVVEVVVVMLQRVYSIRAHC